MATFSLGGAGKLDDLSKVKSYLYLLEEQLKYTFSNLDPEENFNERAKLIYATKDDIQAAIELSLDGITQSFITADTAAEIKLSIDGIRQQYVTKDGVAAAINLNEQGVQIEGNKINLKGTVTANNNFKILNDGSMEAVNAKFSGSITSSEIKIGGPDSSPKFHVTTGGAVTASDITVTGGEIKLGNTAANPYFHVDSDGNMSIGVGSTPPFQVTYAGAVTATKLAIAGGDSSIWLGGNASNPAFSVDKNGNLRIGGTSANPAFQVTSAGVVTANNMTLYGGEINLGLISGSDPADYRFKVSAQGAMTAKSGSITLNAGVSGQEIKLDNTGLSLGGGTFTVSKTGTMTASDVSMTLGTGSSQVKLNSTGLSLGGGQFVAGSAGSLNIGKYTSGSTTDYNFKVTSAGAVTAKNLAITGGSISLGNDFTVTNSGAVTAKNLTLTGGSLKIGGTSSAPVFEVTSGGVLTAKSATLTSLNSTTTNFVTLANGELRAGTGNTVRTTLSLVGTLEDTHTTPHQFFDASAFLGEATLLAGSVWTSVDPSGATDCYRGRTWAYSKFTADFEFTGSTEAEYITADWSIVGLDFTNGLLTGAYLDGSRVA